MTTDITARIKPAFGGGFDVSCERHRDDDQTRDAEVEIVGTFASIKNREALAGVAIILVRLDRKLRGIVQGEKKRAKDDPTSPVRVRWEGPRDVLGWCVTALAAKLEELPGPRYKVKRNGFRYAECANVAVEYGSRRTKRTIGTFSVSSEFDVVVRVHLRAVETYETTREVQVPEPSNHVGGVSET